MISTDGANLNCKQVYHMCILDTKWDGGVKCEPLMRGVVKKCLEAADQANMTSIAIPAIGTGGLRYPIDITARIMYEEINKFSASKPKGSLTDIRVVVYGRNATVCKIFEDEMQKLTTSGAPKEDVVSSMNKTLRRHETRSALFSEFKKENEKQGQMMIGNICLQAYHGDITAETTDAIVNSTNRDLDLYRGSGIQAAILQAGGYSISDECRKYGKLPRGGIIMTSAGNLLCKNIIHVAFESSKFEKILFDVFSFAESKKLQRISMPLLGTGGLKMKPKDVIRKILDTIGSFAYKCKPQTLTQIRVVIFDSKDCSTLQEVMKEFQKKTMKETHGFLKWAYEKTRTTISQAVSLMAPSKTTADQLDTGRANFQSFLGRGFDKVTFTLYACSNQDIKYAVKSLQQFIDEEQNVQEIEKPFVKKLNDEDLARIREVAIQQEVECELQGESPSIPSKIILRGLGQDVLRALTEINKILDDVATKIHNEERQKLLAHNVSWMFYEDGTFEGYDERVSGIIEWPMKTENRLLNFK
ncbi:protein mono-ADP-ribosyltransferase PARP14-like [Ptychodera flava]|uniref:protein mono-ADP-ribosyltransferase PARP14-like n=1 Tax=Ptychodera flava TaxID=63121 RepID=UPI003969C6B4